jgi:structural maintenance of chromosomes protein 5
VMAPRDDARGRPAQKRSRAAINDTSADDSPDDTDEDTLNGVANYAERPLNPFSGFSRGNLVHLQMTNFLTFSDTILRPGPRLNLILGPNGTGKSSIVNAVCIVFNGGLKLLGRNPELSSFVRHGKNVATVEAWLYEPEATGGVRRIKRTWHKDDKDQRQYYLDGKKVRTSDIEDIKKRYDIQLDNLSQFMPQEKIAEFVNMTPEDLLSCTVRALGGTEKLDTYNLLIKSDIEFELDETTLVQRQNRLDEMISSNQAIEAEVAAYHTWQRLDQDIVAMKKYVPWLRHAVACERFKEVKQQYSDADAEVAVKRDEVASMRGPLVALEQERKTAWEDAAACKKRVIRSDRAVMNCVDQLEEHGVKLDKIGHQVARIAKQEERRKNEIERQELDLQGLLASQTAARRDGGDIDDRRIMQEQQDKRTSLRPQMADAKLQATELQAEKRGVIREIHQLTAKKNGLADARAQCVMALDRNPRHRGVGVCSAWIEENQDKFQGTVYGPIAAEVDCANNYHARVLASAIPFWCVGAFVVESSHDQDLLRTLVPEACHGFKPSVLTPPLDTHGRMDMNYRLGAVRPVDNVLESLGIVSLVSDILQAPDAVRSALNAECSLHRMHLGDARADQPLALEKLPQEQGMTTWYTPTQRCSRRGSIYDAQAVSTKVDQLPTNTGFFAGGMDQVEQERQGILQLLRVQEHTLADIDARLAAVESRQRQLEIDMKAIDEVIQGAHGRIAARRKLDMQIDLVKKRIQTAKSSSVSIKMASDKDKLNRELAQGELDSLALVEAATTGLATTIAALARLDEGNASLAVKERLVRNEKLKHANVNSELEEMEMKLAELKVVVKDARSDVRSYLREAEESLSMEHYMEKKEYYEQFPSNLDELEKAIEIKSEQRDRVTTSGHEVVKEHQRKQKLIEHTQAEVADMKRRYDDRRQNFHNSKSSFLEWLENGVEAMRARFSALFKGFDCLGDIGLSKCAVDDRMQELAIEILVSFRGEEMRPIDKDGNSGGEKMATTMLYCFSLQVQDKAPAFVMVDELNQGLDPDNERYIMKVMLQDAERGSAPQSFVVTPKLLLDLPVYKNTATHVIMNGSVAAPSILAAAGE